MYGGNMLRFLKVLVFLATLLISSCAREVPESREPPLEIKFQSASDTLFGEDCGFPSCGIPEGRTQCYDPQTGVFHVQVKALGEASVGFEVTKVSERVTKPIAFRLIGVPSNYGCLGRPLALSVKGKDYSLDDENLGTIDKTLFRVERDNDAVLVQFTEKGQALLEPGTRIGYSVDNNW
jgi:hypothetical protein